MRFSRHVLRLMVAATLLTVIFTSPHSRRDFAALDPSYGMR